MLPVSLPTSVAIPNPSLHESQVFSPYSPFFNPHTGRAGQVPPPGPHHLTASPPDGGVELRDSPPLPHPPALLHPALLAAAQHGSPDYGPLRIDSNDRVSDCNTGDISYDGVQPTISFSNTASSRVYRREIGERPGQCPLVENARDIGVRYTVYLDFDARAISREDTVWTFSKESTVQLSILNREEYVARRF